MTSIRLSALRWKDLSLTKPNNYSVYRNKQFILLKSSKYSTVFLVLSTVKGNRWENRAVRNMDGPIQIVRLEPCMEKNKIC